MSKLKDWFLHSASAALLALAAVLALPAVADSSSFPANPKVTLLGDSYLSYQGYITLSGAAKYYPANDVTSVEQMGWYKFMQMVGGTLEKANVSSGSMICTVKDGETWAMSGTNRLNANELGNPDIILFHGGTNDSWYGEPLGEGLDITDPEVCNANRDKVRPAASYVCWKLRQLYPSARVVVIANSTGTGGLADKYVTALQDAANQWGCCFVALHDIDKQNNHPTATGMQAFADQVYAAYSTFPSWPEYHGGDEPVPVGDIKLEWGSQIKITVNAASAVGKPLVFAYETESQNASENLNEWSHLVLIDDSIDAVGSVYTFTLAEIGATGAVCGRAFAANCLYARYDYLATGTTSAGKTCVPLGVNSHGTMSFDFGFELGSAAVDERMLYGKNWAWNGHFCRTWVASSTMYLCINNNAKTILAPRNNRLTLHTSCTATDNFHNSITNETTGKEEGTVDVTGTSSAYGALQLFSDNGSRECIDTKIYFFNIYEGIGDARTLVNEFVPAMKTDTGVYGYYDLKNKVFQPCTINATTMLHGDQVGGVYGDTSYALSPVARPGGGSSGGFIIGW